MYLFKHLFTISSSFYSTFLTLTNKFKVSCFVQKHENIHTHKFVRMLDAYAHALACMCA